MQQPQWKDDLTAIYLGQRGRMRIQGVVLHDTAGSGTHNDTRYLANPGDGRRVSVDFTVEKDGSIWKLNPQLQVNYCYHAGRETHWGQYRNAAVNRVTVGIEIVQVSCGDLHYPACQVRSVALLCRWLSERFCFPPSHILTHRQIITDGSRTDPRHFPFDAFWEFYWGKRA
jgi:N-acetyl-anhydromuramyl-L-alanine amidase AmpD